MSVTIKLGNLGIRDIENQLGIQLSEEDQQFFKDTHQENVSIALKPGSWHFFDLPRVLEVCGWSLFDKIQDILNKYDLKGRLNMNVIQSDEEALENFFDFTDKDGYPQYLVSRQFDPRDKDNYERITFYTQRRQTKSFVEYEEVPYAFYNIDFLKRSNIFKSNDYLVPSLDQSTDRHIRISKKEFEKGFIKVTNQYFYETFSNQLIVIEKWSGQLLKWISKMPTRDHEIFSRMSDSDIKKLKKKTPINVFNR